MYWKASMKIGILTYHRSHNYGAVLQAYALKKFLINSGQNSVEFIDYFPDYHKKMYTNIKRVPFKNFNIKGRITYPIYFAKDYLPIYILKEIRRYKFNKFIKQYLIKGNIGLVDKTYDVVIYGSDQIWRKQRKENCPGFNDIFFGNGLIKAKKKIAYAASMGKIDLSNEDKTYLANAIQKFDSVSVRESNLVSILEDLSTKIIFQTLDPVFLLKKREWKSLVNKRPIKENYILLYNLQENIECIKIANQIQKYTGLKIIEIIGTAKQKDYSKNIKATAGPSDFIDLTWYATFVVTSSFHGVAFSIIFKKQFYTYLSSNSERVTSLLNTIKLMNRYVLHREDIDLSKSINYCDVDPFLENEIIFSSNYILNSITRQ
jgi:hypothetical protein